MFVDKPVRDPLIMLMALGALNLFLMPSKRAGELMDIGDVVEKALHAYWGRKNMEERVAEFESTKIPL